MERTDKLNHLKQFNRPWEYDCCDIAEKLVELSNLPDDGQLKNELWFDAYPQGTQGD